MWKCTYWCLIGSEITHFNVSVCRMFREAYRASEYAHRRGHQKIPASSHRSLIFPPRTSVLVSALAKRNYVTACVDIYQSQTVWMSGAGSQEMPRCCGVNVWRKVAGSCSVVHSDKAARLWTSAKNTINAWVNNTHVFFYIFTSSHHFAMTLNEPGRQRFHCV